MGYSPGFGEFFFVGWIHDYSVPNLHRTIGGQRRTEFVNRSGHFKS